MIKQQSIHALLNATADAIDAHPERYDFGAFKVPKRQSQTACVLARLGKIAKTKATIYDDVCQELLGVNNWDFERRVTELVGSDWIAFDSAADAAKGLRLYADKYHAEVQP